MRWLAAWLLCAAPASALDPARDILQYSRARWGADEGFGHAVHAVLRTRDGYLWAGTGDGLFRFDGFEFESLDLPREGARTAHVTALHEDAAGRLWIGLMSGLLVRDRDVVTSYGEGDGLPRGSVYALGSSTDGSLWVGTEHGVFKREGSAFRAACGAEARHRIRDLAAARDGGVWAAATAGGGLWRITDGRCSRLGTTEGLADESVVAVREDAAGTLWVGTHRGVGARRSGRFTWTSAREGLSDDLVRSLAVDRDGNVWIGTGSGGLNRLRDGRVSALSRKDGLLGDRIFDVHEDHEGILWLGTQAGIERLQDGTFRPLVTPRGLLTCGVPTVAGSAGGAVWIGTDGEGLLRVAGSAFTTLTRRDGLPDDVIHAVLETPAGALWVHTPRGLAVREGGRFRRLGRDQGLTHPHVRALMADRAGTVWVGTDSGGLFRWDGRRFDVRFPGESVFALHEDQAGALWVGTLHGLKRLQGDVVSSFGVTEGLSSTLVLSFHEDGDGTLWMGTGRGLSRWRGGRLRSYTEREGFTDARLYHVFDDGRGHLWLTSSRGVFQVAKKAFDDLEATGKAIAFTHYGSADGLPSPDCAGLRQPVGWTGPDGLFWIPTLRGVAVVDPARAARAEPPMPIAIQGAVVNGEEVPLAEGARLPAGLRRLEIRFAGLALRAPQRNRYRYRLEGYDADWVDAGTRRVAHYTRVPPGRYRFRVIGRGGDGPWNEEGAAVSFSVAPLFHQTVTFKLALMAVVGLAAAALHHLRVRRLRARMEAVLGERNRIARELHDGLDQGLTGARMQLEVAFRRLPDAPDQAAQHVERALGLMDSVHQDARRAVWALRSQALAESGLAAALAQLAGDLSGETGAAVRVDVAAQAARLPAEVEDQVFRIAQEAITNAVRHGGAQSVIVTLDLQRDRLTLRVHDDGRGFDPSAPTDGLGLRGMQERARAIGAALHIGSRPGGGTEVVLERPRS